jgi:hypothetical protein
MNQKGEHTMSIELEESDPIATFAPVEEGATDSSPSTIPLNDLQQRTDSASAAALKDLEETGKLSIDSSPLSHSIYSELDRIIDEMQQKDTSDMDLDQMLELINKVCTAVFQVQKKITTEVAQQADEARKEHLKLQIGEYRGYSVLAVSAGTGLLHFAGASAGFTSNEALSALCKSAGAYAPATTQAQGILQQKQQGNIAEQSTETEASKLEKQELDQAKSTDSNHIDGAKQKEDARERSLHELKNSLMRA